MVFNFYLRIEEKGVVERRFFSLSLLCVCVCSSSSLVDFRQRVFFLSLSGPAATIAAAATDNPNCCYLNNKSKFQFLVVVFTYYIEST